MGRRRGLAGLTVVAAVACAAVARADFVLPTPHEPGPNTRIAADAVNNATKAVADGDRACQARLLRRRGSTTHDPPPQDMLDAFAVLRRPTTPADKLEAKRLLPFVDQVAIDYIRRARVLPDGTSVYVIPALSARPAFAKRPERCFAREREALEHRLRAKPAQAQRLARRLLRQAQRGQREAASHPPQAGLFLEEIGAHGGGGGGGQDVASIQHNGQFGASYVRHRGSRVIGLVPDGVATIDFTFARGHGLGPEGDRVYRKVYRRTTAVVHNIVFLTVPRMPEDALYNRQVWRAADGSVVNRITPPY
jgi:hypothetical protein